MQIRKLTHLQKDPLTAKHGYSKRHANIITRGFISVRQIWFQMQLGEPQANYIRLMFHICSMGI